MEQSPDFYNLFVSVIYILCGSASVVAAACFTKAWRQTINSEAVCKASYVPLVLLVMVGLVLLVIAITGFIGCIRRKTALLRSHLWAIIALVAPLVAFILIALVGLKKGEGQQTLLETPYNFQPYTINEFSDFLRKKVLEPHNWEVYVRNCFINRPDPFCKEAEPVDDNAYIRKLPREWGCCKPPAECGYVVENGTRSWAIPKSKPVSNNPDCQAWSNNMEKVCYDCSSCKAGVLVKLKKNLLLIIHLCGYVTLYLLVQFSLGFYVVRRMERAEREEFEKMKEEAIFKGEYGS